MELQRRLIRELKFYEFKIIHKAREATENISYDKDEDAVDHNTVTRGARGVMVIVVGNGHGDTSSNPGGDWLHFT